MIGLACTALVARGADDLDAILSAIDDPFPLRSADTSSPRDTLRSFIFSFNQGLDAWQDDAPFNEYARTMLRAADTFDFSDLPKFDRVPTVAARMAQLKEILDRVDLPPFNQIPGIKEVERDNITRWRIPNTRIEIARIAEGPQAGQFLFSKETVARLDDDYALAKELPYKKGAVVNLYDQIRAAPGRWLPKNFAQSLPAWMQWIVGGQAIWQWVALTALVGATGTLIYGLHRTGQRWDKARHAARPIVRMGQPLAYAGIFIAATAAESVTQHGIGIFGGASAFVAYLILAGQVGSLAGLVLTLSGRLADAFATAQDQPADERHIDAALMRILFRLISILFLVFLTVYAADYIGIPIAPLIAGLGVGGLAIALAIRPTLENIIGGLTLFADRPVRVGDFCAYGDKLGTVEEIGLRSTRLRSLERSIVTVPNAEFAQMQIDNMAARDRRLLKTILQLRYETTPEQVRYVLAELRRMLLGHPMVTPDPARVRFIGYGAFSLDVEVFAYIRCREHNAFMAAKEDVLLRMADIVAAAGSGFAFPSQTVYMARDSGLDTERQRTAEKSVNAWRDGGRLPFPEFDPGLRWEMEDILDYPPRGSYGYTPRKGLSEDEPATPATPTAASAPPAPSTTPAPSPPAASASRDAGSVSGIGARLGRWLRR